MLAWKLPIDKGVDKVRKITIWEEDFYRQLREVIDERRGQRYTLDELADRMGIDRRTLWKLYHRKVDPKLSTVLRVLGKLGYWLRIEGGREHGTV